MIEPPATLPLKLHDKWKELAAYCAERQSLGPADLKDLERYILLGWECDALTPKLISAINRGDSDDIAKLTATQERLYSQIRKLSNRLGLSSRPSR